MSTPNIPFSLYKKENHHKLSKIYFHGIFHQGLKNEFETAVVNEPSAFEPLKVYFMMLFYLRVKFYLGVIFFLRRMEPA